MAEGIDYAPDAPAVSLSYWMNYASTCLAGLRKCCIGVRDRQNHSQRAAVQRLGTEVAVFR